MSPADDTCWTTVRAAAQGDGAARSQFGHSYLPLVRAYLLARWRRGRLRNDVEDALQEAFVELLRPGGALQRAQEGRPGGFRAYLYGVARNVARRFERRAGRAPAGRGDPAGVELDLASEEEGPSDAFDRAWARSLLAEAGRRHRLVAEREGEAAMRRVELLRLRFEEGLPIREIAARWEVEPAWLHREYRRARGAFERALHEVVGEHHGGTPAEVRRECARLAELFA